MEKSKKIPKVAIIGRPNTGKSTLVNRISQKGEAIVYHEPMITRDRKYYETDWNGKNFYVLDTGGIDLGSEEKLNLQIILQAKKAIEESDVVIFLVDLSEPATPLDEEINKLLRNYKKDIVFTGNKWDDTGKDYYTEEFLRFGLGSPIKISAMHGINIGDLLDMVVADFEADNLYHSQEGAAHMPSISILGKPNVGKSTLFNTLVKEERAIVDEIEGTTRDSIDSIISINNKNYKFIDTAGLRKTKKNGEDLEYYSKIRTIRASENSDIGLVLIDSSGEITRQDINIVEMCLEKGLSVCIIFSKIDVVGSDKLEELVDSMHEKLNFASYIPFLKVSAKETKGLGKIIKMIDMLMEERSKEIKENTLTNYFKKIEQESGVYSKGKKFKIKFARQLKSSPPYFLIFSNFKVRRNSNIAKFVENNLRKNFGFIGTPIFLKFK